VRALQVAALAISLTALTGLGQPKPAEAEVCMRGVYGYLGTYDKINGCYDSYHWGCITIHPEPI